jgi:hypothetical protein
MRDISVNCLKIKAFMLRKEKLTNLLYLVVVCLRMASMISNTTIGGHMKTMTSKFPGWCRNCRQPFPAGTEINWSPETKATHAYPCISSPAGEPGFDSAPKQQPEQLVPGVYETANGIFVVKYNREKTNLYAKKLVELNGDYRTTEAGSRVDFEFEYAKGSIYDLRLADRMPIERAKELITLYGKCINCARHLKAAKSVEQGIGPVCIKSFGPVINPVVETADGRQIVRAA